ncbi:hypothetical protein Trydic_g8611 [Trypoxylus dichotomus]
MEQIAVVIILFCQFGYYTFPAELIASEFSNVSKAIYTSDWYEYSATFQKLLLVMMKKAHSNEGFSAGGIIPVNIDTFGSVSSCVQCCPCFISNTLYGLRNYKL